MEERNSEGGKDVGSHPELPTEHQQRLQCLLFRLLQDTGRGRERRYQQTRARTGEKSALSVRPPRQLLVPLHTVTQLYDLVGQACTCSG